MKDYAFHKLVSKALLRTQNVVLYKSSHHLVVTGDDNVPTESSHDAIILKLDLSTYHTKNQKIVIKHLLLRGRFLWWKIPLFQLILFKESIFGSIQSIRGVFDFETSKWPPKIVGGLWKYICGKSCTCVVSFSVWKLRRQLGLFGSFITNMCSIDYYVFTSSTLSIMGLWWITAANYFTITSS